MRADPATAAPRGGQYDILIVGGGHNGLVCAAYLAATGQSVCVLERRGVLGGAAVTEEFHPGFRNSAAAYTVSLLNPKIVADLELERHGLRIVERKVGNFLPREDGYLLAGPGLTQAEVARFSARDAERLPAFEARLEAVADALRELVLETPPNLREQGWLQALPELLRAGRVGTRMARLSLEAKRDLLDIFTKSAGEWLDSWFQSDAVKALYGFDSVVGHYASPYAPGSAYVLLHHAFGQVNGRKGVWGHAIGGMGAISDAIAACCRERGVELRTDSAVARVIVEHGQARGVELEDGRVLRSKIVVSNLNPKLLFGQLVDRAELPADFAERIDRYRCGSGTFRINVALGELPRFTCLPEPGDHLTAGIVMAPSLGYMERAHSDARARGWSREPVIEMLIPSTLDPTLAPPGRHVASLFCQHVAPQLPDGADWDDRREAVADHMIATVDQWAPGFAASVLGRQIYSPKDLERVFGLVDGDIFHGALGLDQLFSARPVLGHADYRSPVGGLYQCGAGTHPGGGVTGVPGHNAAREIVRDIGRGPLRSRAAGTGARAAEPGRSN